MRRVAKPGRGAAPAAFRALRMTFLTRNASRKNSVNRPYNGSIDGMRPGPIQELQAARRTTSIQRQSRLVIAGATGALGNEVLRRLVGLQWFESTQVLAREPITPA